MSKSVALSFLDEQIDARKRDGKDTADWEQLRERVKET